MAPTFKATLHNGDTLVMCELTVSQLLACDEMAMAGDPTNPIAANSKALRYQLQRAIVQVGPRKLGDDTDPEELLHSLGSKGLGQARALFRHIHQTSEDEDEAFLGGIERVN
ncbi:MAG: hypothetical protein ABIL09_11100 [Gemmatimonadota bacterium]